MFDRDRTVQHPQSITHPYESSVVQTVLYWSIFLLGLGWMISLWLRSPGVAVQDEIGHILVSRDAWQYPELILNIWGRPVNTLVYMLPALWGLDAARLCSVVLACLTVHLTTNVAQAVGLRYRFFVPLLLWFQPWFNDLSYTAITEVPFAWFLILACYLWLNDRQGWAMICLGLLPLVRHEGIALLGVACCYLLLRKRIIPIAIGIAPIVVYNLIYFAVFARWPFAIYLEPQPTTLYGSGDWLHFVRPLVDNIGLPVFSLALLGLGLLLRHRQKALILIWYGVYFAVQTVIYRFGLYASGGYILFLLPVAPIFAIAAALGLDAIVYWIQQIRIHQPLQRSIQAGVVALVVALAIITGLQTRPRPLDSGGVTMRKVAVWLRDQHLNTSRVIATHVWFYYFGDLPISPRSLWAAQHKLEAFPIGTIVVWDNHYSQRWGLDYATLSDPNGGWRELQRFDEGVAVIFQKVQH